MRSSVNADRGDCQRVIPETRPAMVKADLRKPETREYWAEVGECLDFARRWNGWTLDELAAHLPPPAGSEKRDPRQVQRWISGEEQTQVAVVMAVKQLREPFVIKLAQLTECEVETTVRMRRSA